LVPLRLCAFALIPFPPMSLLPELVISRTTNYKDAAPLALGNRSQTSAKLPNRNAVIRCHGYCRRQL
jgi:hypothetical protein